MTNQSTFSLKPDQILSLAAQSLYKCFFEASRDQAKQIYKGMEKGKQSTIFKITLDNNQEIQGDLSLDNSEFVGKINYSAFRTALGVMLNRISEKLKNEEDLNIFTNEETGEMVFHIPGFVETEGQANVLVMGMLHQAPGIILFRLMFLDPTQFKKE